MQQRHIYTFLTWLLLLGAVSAQNKIDSLKELLKVDKDDTNKVNHLFDLAKVYQVQNIDTLFILATQAMALSEKLNYDKGIASSYHIFGVYYNFKGEYPKALKNYNAAIGIWDKLILLGDNSLYYEGRKGRSLANSGVVYYNMGDYAKAIDRYFIALKISEKTGGRTEINNNLIRIGLAYWNQENYEKALDYETRALRSARETGDKYGMSSALTNIALVYHRKKDHDKALEYYLQALELNREIGNKAGEGNLLNNIGAVYMDKGDYDKAEEYFTKAVSTSRQFGDKYGLTAAMLDLGTVYVMRKQYQKAFTILYDGLELAQETGALEFVSQGYSQLLILYAQSDISLPDTTGGKLLSREKMRLRALTCQRLFYTYRDSVNNEEVKKRSAQKEMQYEFDKKEAAAQAEHEKQMAVAVADRQRQNVILLSISGIGLLVLALAVFVYRSFLQKKKANIELDEKNRKIEAAYGIIEEKQKAILDSIYYARRIQRSLMPNEKYIERVIKELHRS